jgi:hypothetical protein
MNNENQLPISSTEKTVEPKITKELSFCLKKCIFVITFFWEYIFKSSKNQSEIESGFKQRFYSFIVKNRSFSTSYHP